MTKLNPNNGKHFSWDIFEFDIIFHWSQNNQNISLTFTIGIFKFHCESEH